MARGDEADGQHRSLGRLSLLIGAKGCAVALTIMISSGGLATNALAQDQDPDDQAEQPQDEAGDAEEASSSDQRARELYLRGDRLYAEGRYEEAVEAFGESYALSQRPQLQFNLANAYERLGRLEEAVASLRRYAPHAPEYDHETITRRIRALEQRIEQESQARATAAATPAPEPHVTLEPGPEPEETSRGLSVPGLIITGAGIAALITAGIFGALALGAHGDLEASCPSGICPESARNVVDREKTFALVADIGFILGGIAALTGAAFLIWDTGE